MKRRGALRAGIAIVGVVALLACGSVRSVPTEAAWAEVEYASAGNVSAGALESPIITTCKVSTLLNLGLVYTGLEIKWMSPYPSDRVELRINDVKMTTGITRTGTGPYTYTATYGLNLGTILGTLLGATNSVTVRATYPENWKSLAATKTLRIGGVLGLLGPNNCTD